MTHVIRLHMTGWISRQLGACTRGIAGLEGAEWERVSRSSSSSSSSKHAVHAKEGVHTNVQKTKDKRNGCDVIGGR